MGMNVCVVCGCVSLIACGCVHNYVNIYTQTHTHTHMFSIDFVKGKTHKKVSRSEITSISLQEENYR